MAESRRSASRSLAVSMARSNVRPGRAVGQRLGAVGVGALEFGLAVPEPGEVERDVGRHAEQHDPATGPGDAQAVGDAGAVADGVDRDVGARAEVVADHVAAGGAANRPRELRRARRRRRRRAALASTCWCG